MNKDNTVLNAHAVCLGLLSGVVQLNVFSRPHCNEIELCFIVLRLDTPLAASSVFRWQTPAADTDNSDETDTAYRHCCAGHGAGGGRKDMTT